MKFEKGQRVKIEVDGEDRGIGTITECGNTRMGLEIYRVEHETGECCGPVPLYWEGQLQIA